MCLFIDGLRALGYIGGRNVSFEYRLADGDYKRLPDLAEELVALRPDVIYTHTGLSADAAASATAAIPIVVGPAGEVLLTRAAEGTSPTGHARHGVLNAGDFDYRGYPDVLGPAAASLGGIEVRMISDLSQAFAAIAVQRADAILLTADPLLTPACRSLRPRTASPPAAGSPP